MSYGQDARVGIGFQNSYGTALTSSMHWLGIVNESVTLKKAQNITKGMRNVYDQGDFVEGLNTVGGDLLCEAKANAVGVMLAATNNLTSTVTSGSLYTHTFKPRTSDAQAKCAERPFTYLKYMGDGGSAHQYYNLNGNALELSVANGELMTAKLSVVGGDFSRVAAIAAAYSTSNPIDWSVSSVSIGGAAVSNIRALTVTQNNNLEAMAMLDGTRTPSRIKRKDARTVEISGTITFESQTEATAFINQTEQALKVFLQGTSLVQSGYYESLLIDVPLMRFTEFPMQVGGPGEIEVSFKAAAVYNSSSATAIAYTLSCGKAGF